MRPRPRLPFLFFFFMFRWDLGFLRVLVMEGCPLFVHAMFLARSLAECLLVFFEFPLFLVPFRFASEGVFSFDWEIVPPVLLMLVPWLR